MPVRRDGIQANRRPLMPQCNLTSHAKFGFYLDDRPGSHQTSECWVSGSVEVLTDILLSLFALLVDVLLALALLLLAQRLLVLLVEVLLLFAVLLLLRRRLVALRRAVRPVLRLLRRVRVSLALRNEESDITI